MYAYAFLNKRAQDMYMYAFTHLIYVCMHTPSSTVSRDHFHSTKSQSTGEIIPTIYVYLCIYNIYVCIRPSE